MKNHNSRLKVGAIVKTLYGGLLNFKPAMLVKITSKKLFGINRTKYHLPDIGKVILRLISLNNINAKDLTSAK